MAAPLSVCIKEEQCSLIRFLWSQGVQGAAILHRLLAQYGNSALLQRSVYEWIEKLKNGLTIVMHDKGAGQLSTAIIVLLDRRVTIDEVAHVLQISHGSAYEMMHNKLGFQNICPRLVRRQLTVVHKQTRVDIC